MPPKYGQAQFRPASFKEITGLADQAYLLMQCYPYSSDEVLSYDLGPAGKARLEAEVERLETDQQLRFWKAGIARVRASLSAEDAKNTSYDVLRRLAEAEGGPYKAEKSFSVESVEKFKSPIVGKVVK